jgi:hypothetical protein
LETEPTQDEKEEFETFPPETVKCDPPEDSPIFIHQVGHPFSKNGEFTPFYVTLQFKESLLHNCLLHPNATTNMMTEEVMHYLGLSLSQPNAGGGFAKGIIKNLEIAFDSCPNTPFLIDVVIIDAARNLGIILHKDIIENLDGSFHRHPSKATIPHPEGGLFTLYNEPLVGSPVETSDESSDQLLCIYNDLNNWFVQ